jgi:phosphoesterase RecJ-like protein
MDKTVEQWIDEAQNILVICHIAPDGDAIGSLLGLGWALREKGKKHALACADSVPSTFTYLPGIEAIVRQSRVDHDLIVTLDCSDMRRLGTACSEQLLRTAPIINIDHHVTNSNFGIVNWVDPLSASTAEMVTELIERLNVPFSPQIATCLLNGIVADTRGFRTPNTTVRTMQIATELMAAGAPLTQITEHIFNKRSFASMRLWARVIGEVRLLDGGIIWGEISQAMRRECQASEDDEGGLANFLISADEAKVAVILTERENDLIDVGLRATPGLDVANVAVRLGGGGHPLAAGCTIQGSLAAVKEQVLAELRRSLKEQILATAQKEIKKE